MTTNKTSSATTTDMTNSVSNFEVAPASDTGDIQYTCNWTKWLGFYKSIPDMQSTIDKKAFWSVGNGYKADKNTKKTLNRIRGNGKETFNSILYNIVRVYTIGGDFYAEIVRDKRGKLTNLKAMNPGRVEVVANKYGIITHYNQEISINGQTKKQKFPADKILHISHNKIADDIHGISTIEKLTSDTNSGIIEMQQEAQQDLKTVFHRYVKPLLITEIDEDDPTEISTFKAKLDKSVNLGENLVVPKDTVSIERMSIPQYSTLDPLPWLNYLDKLLIKAEGVPGVILGDASDASEATAKILYLAFEQMIKWNQLFIEDQLKAQLNITINLEFPASLEENAKTTTPGENMKKDSKMSNMEVTKNNGNNNK